MYQRNTCSDAGPGSREVLRYALWVDRGGTFTDCVLVDRATGKARVGKFLSSDMAALTGFRALLGIDSDTCSVPGCEVRMGTTLGTNALLERSGPRTALVTSRGFADLLQVRDQTRSELFSLSSARSAPLADRVAELEHRGLAEGSIGSESPFEDVMETARSLREEGFESVAVAFVHGHLVPELEHSVVGVAQDAGLRTVVASSDVSAENGLLARAETALVDAYLTPVLATYLAKLRDAFGDSSRLWVMQSGGGLAEPARFRGKDSVLSGPAGGVVAVAHLAERFGLGPVVGFDMGGTSTDVSRFDGTFERRHETEVGGVVVRAPMVAVHTVAAGGGSVCRLEDDRMRVGPESAGAVPGPLCYGNHEACDLTLTDVNLALGRLVSDRFPMPLFREPVDRSLEAIASTLGGGQSSNGVAEGFFEVATEAMANAIRQVSVAKGYDIREHALVVFGGAAGQHVCAIARRLSIRRIVIHPLAGVMSAWGIGLAPLSWHREANVAGDPREAQAAAAVRSAVDRLVTEGREQLAGEGIVSVESEATVGLRYAGAEAVLDVPLEPVADLSARFEKEHEREFGYRRPLHAVEVTVVRVRVTGGGHEGPTLLDEVPNLPPARPSRRLWFGGRYLDVAVLDRERMQVRRRYDGPLLVLDATGTLVVEPGFTVERDDEGILFVRSDRCEPPCAVGARTGGVALVEGEAYELQTDPVRFEVLSHAFESTAEQMGAVLRRSAFSTNIRDRLDFSCAIFDAAGALVANAPHIPIHLGAMGASVRAVIRAHPEMVRGDAFATNDPTEGGSHLPDITVIAPVVDMEGRARFFVACRGHHADVGGMTPGSMPAFSRSLEDEGVVFRGERILRSGHFDERRVREILCGGAHPARRPDENLGDLQAQLASVRTGVGLMEELIRRFGMGAVESSMRHVLDRGERCVRRVIGQMSDGEYEFRDTLDDGTPLGVRATVRGEEMALDFSMTSNELADSNLNAPRAVAVACILYFLRTLVGEALPLNSGCLRPVRIIIPQRSLLAPSRERAVAGGNVETSQRLADLLFGAFGVCAASQGTMNNVTLGDESFGYYETIGGGGGAGPGFDGLSGVHVHMTNSRITDPEVLESRVPVRVERFGLRHGSGGCGRYRGGDGLVRELRALVPLDVSLLTERRLAGPFGLSGGEPGAAGRNLRLRLDGSMEELPAKTTLTLAAGEGIRIETPGGGGYGRPQPAP